MRMVKEIEAVRAAWIKASPAYEKMEGVVVGTPGLAQFDVEIDVGAAAADDPEGAVSFDITLPDGRVLLKPGNLFGVMESTLWGTEPNYVAGDVQADWSWMQSFHQHKRRILSYRSPIGMKRSSTYGAGAGTIIDIQSRQFVFNQHHPASWSLLCLRHPGLRPSEASSCAAWKPWPAAQ
jgi:hypothetical protein